MNMIYKAIDINGREIQVGDKVAFGDTTSSYNAVICYGEVVEIQKCASGCQTNVLVRVTKNGGWDYWSEGKIRTFIYPRNYYNLMII